MTGEPLVRDRFPLVRRGAPWLAGAIASLVYAILANFLDTEPLVEHIAPILAVGVAVAAVTHFARRKVNWRRRS